MVSRSETVRIVGAAVVGATGALVVTAVMMNSLAFGIFASIGGAVVSAIATAGQLERANA